MLLRHTILLFCLTVLSPVSFGAGYSIVTINRMILPLPKNGLKEFQLWMVAEAYCWLFMILFMWQMENNHVVILPCPKSDPIFNVSCKTAVCAFTSLHFFSNLSNPLCHAPRSRDADRPGKGIISIGFVSLFGLTHALICLQDPEKRFFYSYNHILADGKMHSVVELPRMCLALLCLWVEIIASLGSSTLILLIKVDWGSLAFKGTVGNGCHMH